MNFNEKKKSASSFKMQTVPTRPKSGSRKKTNDKIINGQLLLSDKQSNKSIS